jgi:hypothetical protein
MTFQRAGPRDPRDLSVFLQRPGPGIAPPKVVGTCQACRYPITEDQYRILNMFHEGCVPLVRTDPDGARTYRTPGGGTIRMGGRPAPKLPAVGKRAPKPPEAAAPKPV